jgi:hypothetical protein
MARFAGVGATEASDCFREEVAAQKHKKKLLWAVPIPGTLAPLVGPPFPRASVIIMVVRFDSDRRMSRVTV